MFTRTTCVAYAGSVALLLAGLGLPGAVSAFELRRTAFSGGGVASSGGSYILRATAGEAGPVSARVDAGSFALTEGFWSETGSETPVGVPPQENLPVVNALEQNTPNPFDESTWIRFSVAATARVRLTVFDVGGRRLALLADGEYPPGHYAVWWRGGPNTGRSTKASVVFCRLEIGTWEQTRKMLRLE